MIWILIIIAIPFIAIWMITSSARSMSKSMDGIRKAGEGKTTSEKITMHGCATLIFIAMIAGLLLIGNYLNSLF